MVFFVTFLNVLGSLSPLEIFHKRMKVDLRTLHTCRPFNTLFLHCMTCLPPYMSRTFLFYPKIVSQAVLPQNFFCRIAGNFRPKKGGSAHSLNQKPALVGLGIGMTLNQCPSLYFQLAFFSSNSSC
jgi:hypothetical protein